MTEDNVEPWWIKEAKASMAAWEQLAREHEALEKAIATLDKIIAALDARKGGEDDADGR